MNFVPYLIAIIKETNYIPSWFHFVYVLYQCQHFSSKATNTKYRNVLHITHPFQQ